MIRVHIDGLRDWWETKCPSCGRYMTFPDLAELALCSWSGCRLLSWEIDWTARNLPRLVPSKREVMR